MSADLIIHAMVGITEEDVKQFKSIHRCSEELSMKISGTPSLSMGEVSDYEDPADGILYFLFFDYPVLSDEMINELLPYFPDYVGYGVAIATKQAALEFFNKYKGERVFTIVW